MELMESFHCLGGCSSENEIAHDYVKTGVTKGRMTFAAMRSMCNDGHVSLDVQRELCKQTMVYSVMYEADA